MSARRRARRRRRRLRRWPRDRCAAPARRARAASRALGALQTVGLRRRRPLAAADRRLALLAWRVGAASPRRAAALGLVFGTAWLCAGTWWLFVSMHRYGGLPAPLAALAVLAARRLPRRSTSPPRWRSVARWRARRSLRATRCCSPPRGCSPSWRAACIFTGFPWVASGYAHVDSAARRRSRRGSASTASARSPPALAARFGFAAAAPRARAGSRAGAALVDRARSPARCSAGSTSRRRRGTLHGLAAAGQHPAGREVRRRAASRRRRWTATAAQIAGSARRAGRRARRRPSRCCPRSSTDGYWQALLARFRAAGPGSAARHAAGRRRARLHQLGVGISAHAALPGGSTATTSTTWCRSASSSRRLSAGSRG